VKRKTVLMFTFVFSLLFYQFYNQNIVEGFTVIEKDNTTTEKTIPVTFKKECGNKLINFISYLSPSETEKQTNKVCEIFLNKKDR
jgi:hypothetical protein